MRCRTAQCLRNVLHSTIDAFQSIKPITEVNCNFMKNIFSRSKYFRSVDRSTGRTLDRSTGRRPDRSTGRPVDDPTARPVDDPTARPVDRSTTRPHSNSQQLLDLNTTVADRAVGPVGSSRPVDDRPVDRPVERSRLRPVEAVDRPKIPSTIRPVERSTGSTTLSTGSKNQFCFSHFFFMQ